MPLKKSKMTNPTLINFCKKTLNTLLNQVTKEQLRMFKLMYARDEGRRNPESACRMSIEEVVNQIPASRYDWAITQCENTIEKNKKKQLVND